MDLTAAMSALAQGVGERLEIAVGRALAAIPAPIERRLAGPPIEIDGQCLHYEARAFLRGGERSGLSAFDPDPIADRRRTDRAARLCYGRAIAVGEVEDVTVAGATGELAARRYVPADVGEAGPLLVYFHGGGFVAGSLDTHDQVCRLFCAEGGIRVLSVDYRLAPEHPFPASHEDAIASWRHVAENPEDYGAAPGSIAVGGDSAGGNLAVNVAIHCRDENVPPPAYVAAIYPVCDYSRKRPSHELFGEGFYLTTERYENWRALAGLDAAAEDLRASLLLVPDLSGLPPVHLLIAGFDPLRDELLELAERLREAGNDLELGFVPDIFHGFISAAGTSSRMHEVLSEYVKEFPHTSRTLVRTMRPS